MKAVFADTFYFLALLNERDAAHKRAVAASRTLGLSLVTTELVLLELADALCMPPQREEVPALMAHSSAGVSLAGFRGVRRSKAKSCDSRPNPCPQTSLTLERWTIAGDRIAAC